jgi:hypothetical protein
MSPGDVSAVSSWARKYKVDCATCHEPAAPRLNALGHQFRKMGYRLETEVGVDAKPEAYKELGDWFSFRFRTGYDFKSYETRQAAGANANSFDKRSGFMKPDYTIFYGGTITKNLGAFMEVEFDDYNDILLLGEVDWFGGNADQNYLIRVGQFHTLVRVGWGGFDRPSGISTPDVFRLDKLTTSPVIYNIGQDQRGIEVAYGFTPQSRIIAGLFNGVNFDGKGNRGNGNGSGDTDTAKDVMLAYEQMIGESGFTLFGNYGTWDQKAGTTYNAAGNVTTGVPFLTTTDTANQTEFNFLRVGATASWVFNIFDPKKVGSSELQGGYMYAKDYYPSALPFADRTGNSFWAGVEQRLPHSSSVFYRYDQVHRSEQNARGNTSKHTLGAVWTVEEHLRLALEGFIADEENTDATGLVLQAMLNF